MHCSAPCSEASPAQYQQAHAGLHMLFNTMQLSCCPEVLAGQTSPINPDTQRQLLLCTVRTHSPEPSA